MRAKILGMSGGFVLVVILLLVGVFFVITRTIFGSLFGLHFFEERLIKQISQIPIFPGAVIAKDYEAGSDSELGHINHYSNVYFRIGNDVSQEKIKEFYLPKITKLGWIQTKSIVPSHLRFSRGSEGLFLDFDCTISPDYTVTFKYEDNCVGTAKKYEKDKVYQQIHLHYADNYHTN